MGLILAGILAGALIFGITIWYLLSRNPDKTIATLLLALAFVCVIFGFIEGITEPVSGYKEPEVVRTCKFKRHYYIERYREIVLCINFRYKFVYLLCGS